MELGQCLVQLVNRAGGSESKFVDVDRSDQKLAKRAVLEGGRDPWEAADRIGEPVLERLESEVAGDLDVELVCDLGVELLAAPLSREKAGCREGVASRLRADAVFVREDDDVLEGGLAADMSSAPRFGGLAWHDELGSESIRGDLIRIALNTADHRLLVDHGVVAHPEVSELMGEREALAGYGLGAVDEGQREVRLRDVRAGEAVHQLEDDCVETTAVLDRRQEVWDWAVIGVAELLARITGALGATVRIKRARHAASIGRASRPRKRSI